MAGEVQAVVFDMDGVLLDSEAVYEVVWREAALEMGLARFAPGPGSEADAARRAIDGVHRACLGHSRADSCALLRGAFGADFAAEAFWERTDALARQRQKAEGVPVKAGAPEALAYLAAKGYALSLASSTERAVVERELTDAGLWQYFSVSVCGDEVAHSKPDPEIYRRACERLALPPERCAAVEDSPAGIESAHAAGMRCIMVPDRIAPSDALRPLLWQLCSSLDALTLVL